MYRCPHYLFKFRTLICCLTGLCIAPLANAELIEPPSEYNPFMSPLLKATPDTELLVAFEANGQPVSSIGPEAELLGSYTALPADRELPGASGVVRLPGTKSDKPEVKGKGWIEIPNGATFLNQGAFTIDIVVRFSKNIDTILTAGGKDAQLSINILDRDAGTARIAYPINSKEQETVEIFGIYENTGPLRQDLFQIFTFTYDAKGILRGYIDGLIAFEQKLKDVKGPLAITDGPLLIGSHKFWKTVLQGDFAQVRIQSGAHEPKRRELRPINPAVEGWRFDFGDGNSPTEPGWIGIAPATTTAGVSWSEAPKEGYDGWFFGNRYDTRPEAATKSRSRRAASWVRRDGVMVPPGSLLNLDIPDGTYAVTVLVGNNREDVITETVTANGKVIGENFITSLGRTSYLFERTARGIITLSQGQGLDIALNAVTPKGDEVPGYLQGVMVEPIAPLPVTREGDRIVWIGSAQAPKGFVEAAALYEKRDIPGAFEAAGTIQDPVARNATRAWIMGYPRLMKSADVDRLTLMQEDLALAVNEDPNNIALHYLLSSTDIMRNATIGYVHQWNNGIIYGALKTRPWRLASDLALSIAPEEPWYGNARLLGASAIWQSGQQGGGYSPDGKWVKPDSRIPFDPPIPIFEEVVELYPNSSMARVFLGEMVPVEKEIPVPENAPEWAILQHRAMVRLLDVLHYWYDERMEKDGTMGGGLGDDVEMMRWWNVAILAADDDKAREGWSRLADTAWVKHGKQPMGDTMDDAEHVAEDFSDSHSLRPLLEYKGDRFDEMLERNRSLLPIVRDVLMARTDDGYLMFKSHVYSRNAVDPRTGDAPYNIRTMLPLIWYAYFNQDDQEVTEIITEYARSWKDATLSATDGKPAGITPMMILAEDRSTLHLESGTNRRAPRIPEDGSTDWVYPGYWTYAYPRGYTNNIYDLCLAAYDLTGDPQYLDPLKAAGEHLSHHTALAPTKEEIMPQGGLLGSTFRQEDPEDKARGSLEYAIALNWSGLAKAAAQYRLATGDTQFDEMLEAYGPAEIRTQLAASKADSEVEFEAAVEPTKEALRAALGNLDYNEVLRTELGQSTDRIWVPGSQVLLSAYTGSISGTPPLTRRGAEQQWPTYAVTWEETGPDISALFIQNQKTGLETMLYNFAETKKDIAMRVWRLKPGKYQFTIEPAWPTGQTPLIDQVIDIREKGQKVEFSVPSQQELRLSLEAVSLSAKDS